MQVTKAFSLDTKLRERNCALMVIDVQNDFCHPEGMFAKAGADMSRVERIVQPINDLVAAAHRHGFPVIFIKQAGFRAIDSEVWKLTGRATDFDADLSVCEDGTWGNELYKMTPAAGDPILPKPRYDAFIGTSLESILKSNRIETIVMTGVATNVCVECAIRHACCYDYHVVVAEDGCANWDKAAHDMTMDNVEKFFGTVTDAKTIIGIWDK